MSESGYLKELYSWLRFGKSHIDWDYDGLNSDAMNLNLIENMGAKYILKPKVYSLLNKLGLGPLLISEAAKVRSSSFILILQKPHTDNISDMDLIKDGREFYRHWLEMTMEGYNLSPLSNIVDHKESRLELDRTLQTPPDRFSFKIFRAGPEPHISKAPGRYRRKLQRLLQGTQMIRSLLTKLSYLSLLALCVSCLEGQGESIVWKDKYSRSENNDLEKGFYNFLHYDYGALAGSNLSKGGIFPWKIATSVIRLKNGKLNDQQLKSKLKQFGFIYPKSIENAPTENGYDSNDIYPLGIVRGDIDLRLGKGAVSMKFGRVEGAAIGCATCHTSITYNTQGKALPSSAWLGGSSSSFNAEAFLNEMYDGYKYTLNNKDEFYSYMKDLYPDSDESQQTLLKRYLSEVQKVIKKLDTLGRITAQHNGGPGYTNGAATLVANLGLSNSNENLFHNARGYTSIPVTFDRAFRSNLLIDGLYSVKSENKTRTLSRNGSLLSPRDLAKQVAYFTIPSSGNRPKDIPSQFDKTTETMTYLLQADRQDFPGEIDRDLAELGSSVYAQSCAKCHGQYSHGIENVQLLSFPNHLIDVSEIQTDPVRTNALSGKSFKYLMRSEFTDYIQVNRTGAYAPPLLSQLWKTAPYLHNGSVPTLAALIGLEDRPERFLSGGHNLDFDKVGIAVVETVNGYIYNYKPWSKPTVYDTHGLGQSNKGHEDQFQLLDKEQKTALIEYLKLL